MILKWRMSFGHAISIKKQWGKMFFRGFDIKLHGAMRSNGDWLSGRRDADATFDHPSDSLPHFIPWPGVWNWWGNLPTLWARQPSLPATLYSNVGFVEAYLVLMYTEEYVGVQKYMSTCCKPRKGIWPMETHSPFRTLPGSPILTWERCIIKISALRPWKTFHWFNKNLFEFSLLL